MEGPWSKLEIKVVVWMELELVVEQKEQMVLQMEVIVEAFLKVVAMETMVVLSQETMVVMLEVMTLGVEEQQMVVEEVEAKLDQHRIQQQEQITLMLVEIMLILQEMDQ